VCVNVFVRRTIRHVHFSPFFFVVFLAVCVLADVACGRSLVAICWCQVVRVWLSLRYFFPSLALFSWFARTTGGKIGDEGATALGEALRDNSALTSLNLHGKHRRAHQLCCGACHNMWGALTWVDPDGCVCLRVLWWCVGCVLLFVCVCMFVCGSVCPCRNMWVDPDGCVCLRVCWCVGCVLLFVCVCVFACLRSEVCAPSGTCAYVMLFVLFGCTAHACTSMFAVDVYWHVFDGLSACACVVVSVCAYVCVRVFVFVWYVWLYVFWSVGLCMCVAVLLGLCCCVCVCV